MKTTEPRAEIKKSLLTFNAVVSNEVYKLESPDRIFIIHSYRPKLQGTHSLGHPSGWPRTE